MTGGFLSLRIELQVSPEVHKYNLLDQMFVGARPKPETLEILEVEEEHGDF